MICFLFNLTKKTTFIIHLVCLLNIVLGKVLSQLNHTLFSKSEQYNDVALKALFRLNNNNYVLKSLQRSRLMRLVAISEPNCEQEFYKMIQEHKNSYFQRYII